MANKTYSTSVISWNCEVGRGDHNVLSAVREMARRFHPRMFLLQEANPYTDVLRDGVKGYRLFEPKGQSGEAGDSVILLRYNPVVEFIKRVLRMESDWTGPKAGQHHHGRIFQELELPRMVFVSTHRTRPGWSAGGEAFKEEYEELFKSAQRAKARGKFWASIGDQNIGTRPADQRLKYGPSALARAINGRVIQLSAGRVDSAVVGPGVTGTAYELSSFGSDHNAVLFKFNASLGRKKS